MSRLLGVLGLIFVAFVAGYLVYQMGIGAALLRPWVLAFMAVVAIAVACFAWFAKSWAVLAAAPLMALPMLLFGGLQSSDSPLHVPETEVSAPPLKVASQKLNGLLFGK